MTKEEFLELEKFCKDEWSILAETGVSMKPVRMYKYLNGCPSCSIAAAAGNYFYDGEAVQDCAKCPVDRWRKLATLGVSCGCQEKDQPYEKWRWSGITIERCVYAKQITKMSWSYLPEYEKIKLEDLE